MSTRGRTQELIAMPGDQINTANSGLTSIQRVYACATSYADVAENILVPGYSPSDYPLTALQTAPVRKELNGITTFSCIFYGVLSANQFYRFYDETSSLTQRANFTWQDYNFPFINNFVTLNTFTQDCFISYVTPVITRSFVIPLSDPVKSIPPSLSQWSFLPVLGTSINNFTSTVPLGITVPSGELYPVPQDILSLYGYNVVISKFVTTAFGKCRLVELEYVKTWNGNNKIVQPYFHDPTNLQEGSRVSLVTPQDIAQDISGMTLSVTSLDYDPVRDGNDGTVGGAAPVTITFTGYTNYNSDYPFVGYYITGISPLPDRTIINTPADLTQSGSWFNSLNSYTKLDPGTYTIKPLPGKYTVNLLLLGENSGFNGAPGPTEYTYGMAKLSVDISTKGVPGAPSIVSINDPGAGTAPSKTRVNFTPPLNDGGSDIIAYNVYGAFLNNTIAIIPVSEIGYENGFSFLLIPNQGISKENPIYLQAVNGNGKGAMTPVFTNNL